MVATTVLVVTTSYMLRENILPTGIDIACETEFPATLRARLLAARMVLFKTILILLPIGF